MKALCKHRQIYQTLVTEIVDGRYDATGRLPSEAQLMRRFGVSRPTAARALRDLQSEGVVERRVGAGSFLIKGVKPSNAETSRHLGILLPDIGITELLAAFCGELARLTRANDYGLFWANSQSGADLTTKDADQVCAHFIDRSVRGVFFAPFEFAPDKDEVSKRIAYRLRRAGVAVVLLDRDLTPFPSRSDFDLIGIDNAMAGYLACEHLIKLGNRRIAFVARPLSAPTVLARMTGARNALFDAGLEIPKDFYRIGNPRDAKFVRELTLGRKVDAVICANDLTAAQLMNSLAKLKMRVPEDMRLIGFDNLEYAELLAVPLTTIAQPYREMASNAMRAMRSRLSDPSLPPTTLLSTPSIVVRSSCGAFLQR